MIETDFDKSKLMQDPDGWWLCLKVKDLAPVRAFLNKLQGKLGTVILKEHRDKRSMDANAYAWVLMGKLAAGMRISKEEVYLEYIRDIGDNYQFYAVPDKDKDEFPKLWNAGRLGWIAEEVEQREKGYTVFQCFYGSSYYDTRQMSVLIDRIIHDCQALDIETLPPYKLAAMIDKWGEAA